MTSRRSFYRKVAYLAVIAGFLLVLNWLFRPATGVPGGTGDPGGRLAQVRQQYHLGQTYLGEIDPTSETIKLVTLGMRGIAANLLWNKSTEYHKTKDWTNLAATLKQLAKLQPNFVSVWEYQAWNIAFNVSVEFDDYRQRYRWVIKGLEYLKEGMKYNEREALLPSTMGWFIGHKIGRADEKKQFRKMFKADDDFHGDRPLRERDNWLVARLWHQAAEELIDRGGIMRRQGPLLYRSHAPMCLMNYADNLERDGVFGEKAKLAWRAAAAAWDRYGMLEMPSYFVKVVRLGEKELYQARAEKLRNELEVLGPGLRARLAEEKRARLTAEERKVLATPPEKWTAGQTELAAQTEEKLKVRHDEVARRVPLENRAKATLAASELQHAEEMVDAIQHEREIVNYDYWRLRAQVEQTKELLEAREATYRGDRHYAEGDPLPARKSYEEGFALWRKVLDRFPLLVKDRSTNDDLMDVVKRYRRTLDQLDETFPKNFILQDIVEQYELRQPPPEKPA